MEKTDVQRLARVLKFLVTAILLLNLFCLLLVPGAAVLLKDGGMPMLRRAVAAALELPGYEGQGLSSLPLFFLNCLWAMWRDGETIVLALFYWVCGGCTAVILQQARRILDTILEQNPFQMSNAVSMKRAAVCCWVISGASLVRLTEWLIYERSLFPLFTYTTLMIPAFFMAGLLFLVMSALFRQAAELKEDQDLTI